MTDRNKSPLLRQITLGDSLVLRNRICMSAMTRNRCTDAKKPTYASVKHYADRARDGTGLIISEGVCIYLGGLDWPHIPVMYKTEHAEAWKHVTDAVHDKGGRMFMQVWHAGRAQNDGMPMLKDSGYPVLAPSNIPASGGKYRDLEGQPGHTTNLTPMTNEHIEEVLQQYINSARLAKLAGFDGIEILAQGGYLLHNFLLTRSNQRTDMYGGSIPNRCRFVVSVVDAIMEIWGAAAVGIKICPTDNMNDTTSPYAEISETYTYLIGELVKKEIGYINLSRRGYGEGAVRPAGTELPPRYEPLQEFGPMIKFDDSKTKLLVNEGYTVAEAERLMEDGKIDMICFGRLFIFNPDIIGRMVNQVAFTENDRGDRVLYGPYGDPNEGYNDWPAALPSIAEINARLPSRRNVASHV